uniref:ATP-binding protein n=1 Tax=Paenibacillus koleovorans TaxID=121608 RepID=UPI0035A21CFF
MERWAIHRLGTAGRPLYRRRLRKVKHGIYSKSLKRAIKPAPPSSAPSSLRRGWHSKIGESTLADAILDRIVHSSYTITIEGTDSMRKRKGLIK